MPNFVWLYFSLNGRITRKAYWLLYMLPSFALGYAAYWVASTFDVNEFVESVVIFGFLWPSIAIQAKRWHDLDMSGWWILVNLLPFVGALGALIVNGFMPGTPNKNRYGPPSNNVVSAVADDL